MSPTGQFFGGRTGFELDGQRGSVHVVSASRHAEQHGIQPHRGLRKTLHVDGRTELETHTAPPPPKTPVTHTCSSHLSRLHQKQPPLPPRLYFDTVKTIMGFFLTTATHSNIHPEERDTDASPWPVPPVDAPGSSCQNEKT